MLAPEQQFRITFPAQPEIREVNLLNGLHGATRIMQCKLYGREAWLPLSDPLPENPVNDDSFTKTRRELEENLPDEDLVMIVDLSGHRLIRNRVRGENIDLVDFTHPYIFSQFEQQTRKMDMGKPPVYSPIEDAVALLISEVKYAAQERLWMERCGIYHEEYIVQASNRIDPASLTLLARKGEEQIKTIGRQATAIRDALTLFHDDYFEIDKMVQVLKAIRILWPQGSVSIEKEFGYREGTNESFEHIVYMARLPQSVYTEVLGQLYERPAEQRFFVMHQQRENLKDHWVAR